MLGWEGCCGGADGTAQGMGRREGTAGGGLRATARGATARCGNRQPCAAATDNSTLRQQLQMLEKKEDHLQKKIDEDLKKAKANAVTNKGG